MVDKQSNTSYNYYILKQKEQNMPISIIQAAIDFKPKGEMQMNTHRTYQLWEGEVLVDAYIHVGAHGYYSAAMVIGRMDSPLETRDFENYNNEFKDSGFSRAVGWVAEQLNEIATPKLFAAEAGTPHSEIIKVK
jgi:hypothetical protein